MTRAVQVAAARWLWRLCAVYRVLMRDGHYCYGRLEGRKGRVVFVYTDLYQSEWDAKLGCIAPVDVRKVYPDVVAFSKDWRITAQLPLV